MLNQLSFYWDYEVEDIGVGWRRICGTITGGYACVLDPHHEFECMFSLQPISMFQSISGYFYARFV
jgi:hypothetical protein